MPIQKRFFVLLVAVVLMCTVSITALAHDVPDLSRRGSISIVMRHGEKAVPGGSLTLYQVGVVYEEDGDYSFILSDAFSGSDLSLEDIQSARLAKELADYAGSHGISGVTKKIEKDGTVLFSDLDPGLYLLVQREAAVGYYKAVPFLVSVPMLEEGKYVYDVDASPKVELKKEPEPPEETETPQEPETPEEPETPQEPESPENPGIPEEPDTPEIPGMPKTPENSAGDTLPQTGQLNWPIPVLVVFGLCLFSTGWMLRFGKKKDGHEK